MKLIDRYIVSRLVMWLAVILLAVALLYVMIDLTTRTRADIIEYDAPAKMVFLYYLNYLPLILLQMAPVAYLIASLFVLGNFARNNEYTALLAGGVSMYRFAVAPIVLSAVVAVCALCLGEFVLPQAARRAEYLEETYLEGGKSERTISMAWSRPDQGRTYFIRSYDPDAQLGEEVMITKREGRRVVKKIEAESVFWDTAQEEWMLANAVVINVEGETETRREEALLPALIDETPAELEVGRRSADEKSFGELRRELARRARAGLVYPEKWVDLHSKIALPVTNFIIFFLALPFALKVKRGGMAVTFGVSLAIGVAYMSLFEVGQALGRAQYLAPWVAAWAPNMIFLAAGVCLTLKTET
jgi:lipopolysaccharide export system permease protein